MGKVACLQYPFYRFFERKNLRIQINREHGMAIDIGGNPIALEADGVSRHTVLSVKL